MEPPEKVKLWEYIQKRLRTSGDICSLYVYCERVGAVVDRAESFSCSTAWTPGWGGGNIILYLMKLYTNEPRMTARITQQQKIIICFWRTGGDTEIERNTVSVMVPPLWIQ